MKLTGQVILIISPQAWGENFVSKHHYAVELAEKGNLVYFLNPPSNSFRVQLIKERLFVIDYTQGVRGLTKLPSFLSSWIIQLEYQRLAHKIGRKIDIIWNFDSSRFFNLSKIKNTIRICHIVDLNENIQRNLLAKTADVCLCTSNFIKKELMKFNSKTSKVHHGYHSHPPKKNQLFKLQGKNKTRALYVGNLAIQYIDWSLLTKLIINNKQIDFYFIGNTEPSNLGDVSAQAKVQIQKVMLLKNTYFLGSKPASLIPYYLVKMDVLLLTYKSDKFLEQLASPHKMMEYLGSGKTVISTYCDEYKDKRHLLEMVDDNISFLERFQEVVSNLEVYNSDEKQNQRKKFAMNNSYANQLARIEYIISENIE